MSMTKLTGDYISCPWLVSNQLLTEYESLLDVIVELRATGPLLLRDVENIDDLTKRLKEMRPEMLQLKYHIRETLEIRQIKDKWKLVYEQKLKEYE